MRGMVVTARMAEPIVHYEDGLHLDGILAWGAYRDLTEDRRWELPPITGPMAVDFDLPLDRWEVSAATIVPELGAWGWMATQPVTPWERHGIHEIRKRVAYEEMARYTRSPSVNPSLGGGKAYDLKVPTVFAREVQWLAIGDLDEVRRLLSTHVYGVGKHCAKGMGRVIEWRVDRADVSREEVVRRRVVACTKAKATAIRGIRPPYHHASRQTWAETCL